MLCFEIIAVSPDIPYYVSSNNNYIHGAFYGMREKKILMISPALRAHRDPKSTDHIDNSIIT